MAEEKSGLEMAIPTDMVADVSITEETGANPGLVLRFSALNGLVAVRIIADDDIKKAVIRNMYEKLMLPDRFVDFKVEV